MKRHIPNSLTLLNILFGSLAIIMALQNSLLASSVLLLIAFHCDIFDGLSARILKAQSDLGKELDSLADVVSFGVAPAMLLYALVKDIKGVDALSWDLPVSTLIPLLVPFILPLFAALRLAKFNIDPNQTHEFRGLPTPANALMVLGIPFILSKQPDSFLSPLFSESLFYIIYPVVVSALMVTPVRLYSLKPEGFSWKKNIPRYLFILISIVLVITSKYTGLVLIIVFYYIYGSIMAQFTNKPKG